jgi:hypothetical protein
MIGASWVPWGEPVMATEHHHATAFAFNRFPCQAFCLMLIVAPPRLLARNAAEHSKEEARACRTAGFQNRWP